MTSQDKELISAHLYLNELKDRLEKYERVLAKAETDSKCACDRRGALPPGTSRAKMTTANARWMAAAEHRDRMQVLVDKLKEKIDRLAGIFLTIHRPDGSSVTVTPNKMWGE